MGGWNLEGTQKTGAKTEAWKEKIDWAWKFKTEAPTIKTVYPSGGACAAISAPILPVAPARLSTTTC